MPVDVGTKGSNLESINAVDVAADDIMFLVDRSDQSLASTGRDKQISVAQEALLWFTQMGLGSASTRASADFDAAGVAAAAVATEAGLRTSGDAANASAIATETGLRISGDATNASAVTSEAGTRATADTTNASAITAETSARTVADTAETNARTTADGLLIPLAQKGAASGVATLDGGSVVPVAQIPAAIARSSDVSTSISTAINALIASAPGTLDTLNELATALGNDPNFSATITTLIGTKISSSRTLTAGTGLTGGGDLSADRSFAVAYGTTSGTAAQGNDGRLSDARTPTAHAASHAAGGSDPLTLTIAQITSLQTSLNALSTDSTVVHNTGTENVGGVKTFTSAPVVPSAAFPQSAISGLVTALGLLASLASPTFTGTVGLPAGTVLTTPAITDPTGLDSTDVGLSNVSNNLQLTVANNLSEITGANIATARTNLGLGTASTHAATDFALSTTTITAGTGLSGGGDLSANRTVSLPAVGTAGTYGDASHVAVVTTDAQGRTSAVTATAIALATAAITGLDTALAAKQPLAANLTALGGLTTAVDTLAYFTGSGAAATTAFNYAGRAIAAGNVWASRANLSLRAALGTSATLPAKIAFITDSEGEVGTFIDFSRDIQARYPGTSPTIVRGFGGVRANYSLDPWVTTGAVSTGRGATGHLVTLTSTQTLTLDGYFDVLKIHWLQNTGTFDINIDGTVIAGINTTNASVSIGKTSASPTITSAGVLFATAMIGATITGLGIPTGTTITAVASGSSATMSQNATNSTTVTAVIGYSWQSPAFVQGNHTVTLTCASGTVKIDTAMYFAGNSASGVQVWLLAHSGWTTADMLALSNSGTTANVPSAVNDLQDLLSQEAFHAVVFETCINDSSTSNYNSWMGSLLTATAATLPNATQCIFLPEPKAAHSWMSGTSAIAQALSTSHSALLADMNVVAYDHSAQAGNVPDVPYGLTYDGVHYQSQGDLLASQLLLDVLDPAPPASAWWNYSSPGDGGYIAPFYDPSSQTLGIGAFPVSTEAATVGFGYVRNAFTNGLFGSPGGDTFSPDTFFARVGAGIWSTLTGRIQIGGASTILSNLDAIPRDYVDSMMRQPVKLMTTTCLPQCVYSNGTAGVGATLTAVANGALGIDAVSVAANDRVAVGDQASSVVAITKANSSTAIVATNSGSFTAGMVGRTITGTGIQPATTITVVTDSTHATISLATTNGTAANAVINADFQDGIYIVTQPGDGSTKFVLTRATAFDEASEIKTGIQFLVTAGTVYTGSTWAVTSANVSTMGTDSIVFSPPTLGSGAIRATFALIPFLGFAADGVSAVDANIYRLGANSLGTDSSLTILDGKNIIAGTTSGTSLGSATNQHVGVYGFTTAQQANSVDVLTVLTNFGLRATGGNPPLNLGTGALTCGHLTAEAVTSTGATGTNKLVFDTSPTISAPTISGHPVVEGVTSTGATGTGKFVFDGTPTLVTPVIGAATGTSLAVTGLISSSGTAGVGYATGAGGAITQTSSKSAGVTNSNICGQITTTNSSLAAGTSVFFTVTNTLVAATDAVIVNLHSGAAGGGDYLVTVDGVNAGSFRIHYRNLTAGALTDTLVFNFAVIKSVAA